MLLPSRALSWLLIERNIPCVQTGWPCSPALVKGHHQPVAETQPGLISFKLHSVAPLSSTSICLGIPCCQGSRPQGHTALCPLQSQPWCHHQICREGTACLDLLEQWLEPSLCRAVHFCSNYSGLLYLRKMIQYLQLEPGAGAHPIAFVQCQQPLQSCTAGGFQRDRGQEKRKSLGN